MRSSQALQRWVLILTSAASLMVALDQLVVATALSTIQRDLNASIETLEWTVNAYALSFAVMLMTGAALGDRLGRRRVFVWGLTLFTAASVACAVAPNVGWLVAARAVQGLGSAMVMPLAMALLTAAFPVEKRGRALGIFTALTGLAVVGGPVVGGAITEGLAWQWIFWINVPIGIVVIPLVLRQIDESFGPKARIDTGGVLLVTGATLGLVWGLVRANSVGWLSVEVLGTLAAGVVLGAAFVWWELRTGEPMLPMRLFRIPAFTAGNASALLLYGSLLSTVFFLAQYLQVSLGYGPLAAGIRVLPWTSTVFILAPVSGVLADRIGARPLIVLGLVLQAVGFGWIANNIDHGRSYSSSIAALIIAGCGVTMAMPAVQNAVMNSVPSAAIGKASGAFNTVRQLGAVFGVAVLAATFSAHGSYRSPVDFGNGVGPALAVAAAMSLAGAIIGLGTPGRVRRDVSLQPSPQPAMEPALVTGGADNATG